MSIILDIIKQPDKENLLKNLDIEEYTLELIFYIVNSITNKEYLGSFFCPFLHKITDINLAIAIINNDKSLTKYFRDDIKTHYLFQRVAMNL